MYATGVYSWDELISNTVDILGEEGWADSAEFISDGSLGWAAYQMAITFGLDTEDEEYDLTCAHSRRWPAPAADSYVDLYMEITCSETTAAGGTDENGTCEVVSVPYHTIYNYFVEGDYKRASMDAEMYTAYVQAAKNSQLEGMTNYDSDNKTYWNRTEARARYAFAGKVCIYWDNWDGMNP